MVKVCVDTPTPRPRSYARAPARRRTSVRKRAPARRRPTRRRAPVKRNTRRGRRLTKYEMGQVNPFDREVDGAKIPDANTQPSDTIRVQDRFSIVSNVGNNAMCSMFWPNLEASTVTATPGTSTSWTWPASYAGRTQSQQLSNILSSASLIRAVCHGIRLSSPIAPTSAVGFVHIACIPISDFGATTWAAPTSLSQMSQLPWYKRYTLASLTQKSYTVVNKFLDATATRYFDPGSDLADVGTDTSFHSIGGWCCILVAVEGAVATATVQLSVENLVHYESIPKFSAVQNSSPAANYDPQQLATTSRIAGNMEPGFFEGEEAGALSNAYAAITSGMRDATNEILNSYVYPGARRAGYAATYAGVGYAARRFGGGGISGVNTPRLFQG